MTYGEGALHDLNDLRFFAAVVQHRGFSAAGRALGTPKSRLSKRVAQLEERLGVRLLQRTTRRFAVTDIGERFYAHCRAALEEAQAAQDVVDELRAEPRGIVRVSCPVSIAQTIVAHVLPDFLLQCPKVQVRMLATNRRVDVIAEGFDLAIRVRDKLDTDATLVLRTFGRSRVLLVASAAFLDLHGRPQQPSTAKRSRIRRIPRRAFARSGAVETRAMHETKTCWTSGAQESMSECLGLVLRCLRANDGKLSGSATQRLISNDVPVPRSTPTCMSLRHRRMSMSRIGQSRKAYGSAMPRVARM